MVLAGGHGVWRAHQGQLCHPDGGLRCCISLRSTGMGLLMSTFTAQPDCRHVLRHDRHADPGGPVCRARSTPVSSLEGVARWIGEVYPATHMLPSAAACSARRCRLHDLQPEFWALGISAPVIIGAAIALLRKQES